MFILKKNTKLKIRKPIDLENDKKINSLCGEYFDRYGNFLTKKMLSFKEIEIPNDISLSLKHPFFYKGWWWYFWMFENISSRQLKIE